MSGVMLLNHLGDELNHQGSRDAAERIKAAYNRALQEGRRTRDLGGELGTEAFADAVIERLG